MSRTVRVAGHDYVVEMMPKDWVSQTESRGQCDSTALRIRIARGLPISRATETLLHEIGHAIYHEYNIDNVKKGEESLNSLYMSGMHQVLRDNPWLGRLYATQV